MIPGISCIFRSFGRTTVRPPKTGRWSSGKPQNTGEVINTGTSPLGANQGFHFFRPSPQLGLRNRPTVPPLNTVIISWSQLGHIVLVLKTKSHFSGSSNGYSCASSCAQRLRRDSYPAKSHSLSLLFTVAST